MADESGGLSRRTLLYGLAATGAAAGSGSGVAAMLTDTESAGTSLAAGELDLDVRSPAGLQGEGSADSLALYEPTTTEFELSVADNPAYVWLVAGCPTCEPIESKLDARLELTRGGAETTTLFEGTLRALRETYGAGALLSTEALAGSGETWTVSFTWELVEVVDGAVDVGVDLGFRAVQARHLGDPRAHDLGLPACGDCDDDDPGDGACGEEISFVAFCSETPIDASDIAFTRQTCGDTDRLATLRLTEIPTEVDHVLLKYATNLDVFVYEGEATPFSITTGGSNSDLVLEGTYTQDGNEFPGSGTPPRSTSDPCPDGYWAKYNFDDTSWESGEPAADTSGGGASNSSDATEQSDRTGVRRGGDATGGGEGE